MIRRSTLLALVLLLMLALASCSGGGDGEPAGGTEATDGDGSGQADGGGGGLASGGDPVFEAWARSFCSAYSAWDRRLSGVASDPGSGDPTERSRWAADYASEIVDASADFVEALRAIEVPRELLEYHFEVDSWVESEQLSIVLYVDDPEGYPLESDEDIRFFLDEVAYWADNLQESAERESAKQSPAVSEAFHAALDANPDCAEVPRTATVTVAAPEATPQSEFPHADVPFFSCAPVLGDAEVETALDLAGRSDRSTVLLEDGDTCTWRLASDSDIFVVVRPSHPDDFAPGATLLGVTGTRVRGVGDAALWFGGSDAVRGGDVGTLSVAEETSLGMLAFRIVLGRPDLDSSEQLEVASTVARAALGRFPREESLQPPVEIVVEPPDLAQLGYLGNIVAREEAGDWTLGGGLVATLGMFAGEREPEDVLTYPDLIDLPAEVLEAAEEYLESPEADPEEAAEVERLLSVLRSHAPPREWEPPEAQARSGT